MRKVYRAFSIIELMAVIAITAIILLITTVAFDNINKYQALDDDYNSTVALLRQANSLSITSKDGYHYGVYFSSSTASLFRSSSHSSTTDYILYFSLNERNRLINFSLAGASTTILFDKISGATDNWGTLDVAMKNSTGTKRTITVFSTGLIQ